MIGYFILFLSCTLFFPVLSFTFFWSITAYFCAQFDNTHKKNITSKMSFQKSFLCLPDSVTELVVGADFDISVTVSVKNEGDDSFNARIVIPFPPSLSYRRVSLIEVKGYSVLHQGWSLCSDGI